jgi:hypothetical protein
MGNYHFDAAIFYVAGNELQKKFERKIGWNFLSGK